MDSSDSSSGEENSSNHRAQRRGVMQRTDLKAIDRILDADAMGAAVKAMAQLKMTGQQLLEFLKQPHVQKRIRIALLIALAAGFGTYGLIMCAGFGTAGITGGSLAAWIQSVAYGASIPAGSFFASLQSMGALGTLSASFAIPAALTVGGTVGGAAVVGIPVVQAAGTAAIDKIRGWFRRGQTQQFEE